MPISGVSGVSLHTLRHFSASMLIASGRDVPTVARRRGHSDGRASSQAPTTGPGRHGCGRCSDAGRISAAESGGVVLAAVLGRLRDAGAAQGATLDGLHASGKLTCPPSDLYGSLVHLHLNRLLAAGASTERRAFGLLSRLRAGLAASGPPPSG